MFLTLTLLLILTLQGIPCSVWGQRYLVRAPSDWRHGGPGNEVRWRLHLGLQELRWRCTIRLSGSRLVRLTRGPYNSKTNLKCSNMAFQYQILLTFWHCTQSICLKQLKSFRLPNIDKIYVTHIPKIHTYFTIAFFHHHPQKTFAWMRHPTRICSSSFTFQLQIVQGWMTNEWSVKITLEIS